ncbi:MAG: TolC family protein [Hyphomicrobiales bacterium]
MRKPLPLILSFLFLCCCILNLQAQEYTLKECINKALVDNDELHISELELMNAGVNRKLAISPLLPQIDIQGKFTDNFAIPPMTVPGDLFGKPGQLLDFVFGTQYDGSLGFVLQQQVLNLPLSRTRKLASEEEKLAGMNHQNNKEALVFNVAFSFYSALATYQSVQMLESQIALTDSLIQIVRFTRNSGSALNINVNQLLVQRSNQHTSYKNALAVYYQYLNQLKTLLNMPADSDLQLTSEKIDLNTYISQNFNPKDQITYKILEQQHELAQLNLKVSKGGFYPTISVFANARLQNMHNGFAEFVDGSWDDGAAAGITLNIPVFNGLSKKYEVRSKNIDVEKSKYSLSSADIQLQNNYNVYLRQLQYAKSDITSQAKNKDLARELMDMVSDQYRAGSANISDLINAQNDLYESELNYLQAVFKYRIAEINLLKISGKILSLVNPE